MNKLTVHRAMPVALGCCLLLVLVSGSLTGLNWLQGAVSGEGNQQMTRAEASEEWPMFLHDLNHSGYTAAEGPTTDRVIWSFITGGWVMTSPVIADDRVYFGSNDKKVYCVNGTSGNEIWHYTTGGFVDSSPSVVSGRVYVSSQDTKVRCLNASNGDKLWEYATGGLIEASSPAVYDGRVYVGSYDNRVHCINQTTGTGIWSYLTGGDICTSPAVSDGLVYAGSRDGKLYCLNSTTGQERWSYATGSEIWASCPSLSAGKAFVGSFNGKVYCLDAAAGTFLWSYTTGSRITSSPTTAHGYVYIGSDDNKLYCFNQSTGAVRWSYTTGHDIGTSAASIAGGRLYVGSCDDRLYCIDAYTGSKLWDHLIGDNVHYSAIAGSRLYVSSINGRIYAFEDEGEPPDGEYTCLYDHFTSSPNGYNGSLWTLETYGTGSVSWDGVSVTGLTASGHGHRTLVSKDSFCPGHKVIARLNVTDASANPCWGWTDKTATDWNYHFLDCNNGIWMQYNYPAWDDLTFYTKKNGIISQYSVSVDPLQFHDYEFRWNATTAELSVDGQVKITETTNVPIIPLKYKMTVTAWWGNPTGQWLYVDYVNVSAIAVEYNAIQVTNTAGGEGAPHLTTSGNGFYLAYCYDGDILLRFSSDGLAWSEPTFIEQGSTYGMHDVDICRTSDGKLWAAARRNTGGATYEDIYIISSADGQTWSTPLAIVAGSTYDTWPRIVAGPDDVLWVLYSRSVTTNVFGDWDLYLASSSDGVSWSPPKRITDNTVEERWGDLVVDSDGSVHVSYQVYSGGSYFLYETHSSDGVIWSEGVEIAGSSYMFEHGGSMTQLPNGSYSLLTSGGSIYGIYELHSSDAVTWSAPQLFLQTSHKTAVPDLITSGTSGLMAFLGKPGAEYDIYSLLFSVEGPVTTTTTTTSTTTTTTTTTATSTTTTTTTTTTTVTGLTTWDLAMVVTVGVLATVVFVVIAVLSFGFRRHT